MSGSMIELHQVRKHYDTGDERIDVLTGVDLEVAEGETVALTGDSGCGKTTLLHLIAGFEQADAGRIRVASQELGQLDDPSLSRFRRERLGMVFQQFNLLSPLSVADNILLPLRLQGREDRDWLGELVARLKLEGLLNRYPDELSGGQQQRVALARALIHRPPLLLADEPTGSLDESNSEQVMALMRDLVETTGTTLVLVTHSRAIAAWSQRQIRLEHGQVHER